MFFSPNVGLTNIYIGKNLIKKLLDKINALIKDIDRNGVSNGTGKPELLKYRKQWSRRINHEDRLVYKLDDNGNLVIVSCRGHYDD